MVGSVELGVDAVGGGSRVDVSDKSYDKGSGVATRPPSVASHERPPEEHQKYNTCRNRTLSKA